MYAIKVELKLNNREKTLMAQNAGFSRWVYNYGLSLMNALDHKEFKGGSQKKIGCIKKVLTNHTKKKPEFNWTRKMSSRVYQHAFADLAKAYENFFKGRAKRPVLKSRKNSQSFTVDSSSGKVVLAEGKKIKIPTLGIFRLKEALPCCYVTQSFTLSKIADKWFVSFCVDAERLPPLAHPVIAPVGIDLGVKCFATMSDNSVYDAPKPYKKAKIKLAKLQYHNRNKRKGDRKKQIAQSNNARRHYQQLARQHRKIADQRQDFLQKTTTEICQRYKTIVIEDLNIKGMIANHKLSSAISDLGFYEFRRQLEYKSKFYSTNIHLADRWFPSSKTCSDCGNKKTDLKLKDRIFDCNCGLTLERDLNAAINLSRLAK